MTQSTGPHAKIPTNNNAEQFLAELFDALWNRYRQRVNYVQIYEQEIANAGATFVNDHIAFRTLAGQNPLTGIASLSRVFTALGYQPITCYHFADKHLDAIHFQHPNQQFPKLFISELRTWELSDTAQNILTKLQILHRKPIPLKILAELSQLETAQLETVNWNHTMSSVIDLFHTLPWNAPEKEWVETLNDESQYAAWVAVHGFNVNHFTALINSHNVESLNDIEKTINALRTANVPMKETIEGTPGSKLRQSATEAVVIDVPIQINQQPATMPWTYAYFEFAERGTIPHPETGDPTPFEGFLGSQATHLFEMTQKK